MTPTTCPRRVRHAACSLLLLSLSPLPSAQAQARPEASAAGRATSSIESLRLEQERVRVRIDRQHAATTIEETFVNAGEVRPEGRCSLRTGGDASVNRFAWWSGTTKIVGERYERQVARGLRAGHREGARSGAARAGGRGLVRLAGVVDVAGLPDGSVLAAMPRHGLMRVTPGGGHAPISGIPDEWRLRVSARFDGAAWVGTQGGAARVTWEGRGGQPPPSPHPCVHAIREEGQEPCVGTEGGLAVLRREGGN